MSIITFNDIHGAEQTVDLSQEKFNVAFNADCMEFFRACPNRSFSWIVADPPYGDGSSQSVNVEREREREREAVQSVRGMVRPVQNSGTDSARDSTDTSISKWDRFAGGTTFKRYQQLPPRIVRTW